MYLMQKTLILLVFSAVLAFSQERLTVSKEEAAHAWSVAGVQNGGASTSPDLPPIDGTAIPVEAEVNGTGRVVYLTTRVPGLFLMQSIDCNGVRSPLGEIGWQMIGGTVASVPIFKSVASNEGKPFVQGDCFIEIFHYVNGVVAGKTLATVIPYKSVAGNVQFAFVSEGMLPDGRYFVRVSGPTDKGAVAAISRYALSAEIVPQLFGGSMIIFPPNIGLPVVGPTSLTLCQAGQCGSIVFDRKIEPPNTSGKG